MAPLFKSGSDLFEQGLDCARRRDFPKAIDKFSAAAEKFSREGSPLFVQVSQAHAAILSVGSSALSPDALDQVATFLQGLAGYNEIRLGLRPVSSALLATQLQLAAREARMLEAVRTKSAEPSSLAQALQRLSADYLSMGAEVLFMPEYFANQTMTAASRSPMLMAISFELLGTSTEAADPLGAAEHFQAAQQYWAQAGSAEDAGRVADHIEKLSFQARCWFCGREGAGHGIQFVSLPVDAVIAGLKAREAGPLPTADRTGSHVYACKGCDSAIHSVADHVATARAAQVATELRREMHEMEARLKNQRVQR